MSSCSEPAAPPSTTRRPASVVAFAVTRTSSLRHVSSPATSTVPSANCSVPAVFSTATVSCCAVADRAQTEKS